MTNIDSNSIAASFALHVWEKYQTQCAAAKAYQCSAAMVSNVVHGLRPPSKKMLADMGLKRQVVYTRALEGDGLGQKAEGKAT